jgi:hypothetical protein
VQLQVRQQQPHLRSRSQLLCRSQRQQQLWMLQACRQQRQRGCRRSLRRVLLAAAGWRSGCLMAAGCSGGSTRATQ